MAVLNEEIGKIEAGSSLDKLYNSLLSGFIKAQDDKLPDYTSSEYVTKKIGEDGAIVYIADEEKIKANVEEQKLITMKNAAYLLASSVVGNSPGGGSSGGGSGGGLFVSKSGDYMTGKLSTLFGFDAGENGVKILEVYQTPEANAVDRTSIVKVNGELHLDSYGLFIDNNNVMNHVGNTLTLLSPVIKLDGSVQCSSNVIVGKIDIEQDGLYFNDADNRYIYYHSGIANKKDVDWTMKNGTVDGNLLVNGDSVLNGSFKSLHGCLLGANGNVILDISNPSEAVINADLKLSKSLFLADNKILYQKNAHIISLSAPKKILNIGDDATNKINLQTGVYDDDGEYQLISKFGDGYFPNSFRAGYALGSTLIETYKNDTNDSGVFISKWLKFNNSFGPGIHSNGDYLQLQSPFKYNENIDGETSIITEHKTVSLQFQESTSLYAPLNKKSASLFFTTDADFYVFDKPIESQKSIGITNSKTRLSNNQLFFDSSVYLQALTDGIKYYGNAYIVNNIGSVQFSSGFAGSGWQIYKNLLTGNINATFDELTVRKKMRIYELEVQKQSVTNGSLWVSDACSGDLVEEII